MASVRSEGSVTLQRAVDEVRLDGGLRRLARAWDREVGPDGLPKRLPAAEWRGLVRQLGIVRQNASPGEWPAELDARIEPLVRAVVRMTRHGGAGFWGTGPSAEEMITSLGEWSGHLSDPALSAAVHRLTPGKRLAGGVGLPLLPAFADPRRPLAVLRPDWNERGDWIGLARSGDDPKKMALELAGNGTPWLGGTWGGLPDRLTARAVQWSTGAFADHFAWRVDEDGRVCERSAILLRNRGFALLSELQEGSGVSIFRLGLAPEVSATVDAEGPTLALQGPRRASCRILPIGLGRGAGQLIAEVDSFRLEQPIRGRRGWMPLLVSWDAARNRKAVRWRVLTVAEKSKVCGPDVAFAARVWWGTSESLVVYRSLATPRTRSFLGYQTTETLRFLIGEFTPEGQVRPWFKIEEGPTPPASAGGQS